MTNSFNRGDFAATKVDTLKEQEKEAANVINRNTRPGYLSIKEGSNTFRIFPAHPGCKSFIVLRGMHWLPVLVDDEKSKTGKTEKRKPIYSGKVHSRHKECVIDQYIKLANSIVSKIEDDVEKNRLIEAITGFKEGITMRSSWVCYAQKITAAGKEFGRLEISTSVKDKMNDLAIGGDEVSEPVSTDPFSDPDTGRAIIITYNKEEQPAKKYKVSIDWRAKDDKYRLTDEELQQLAGVDSLDSMFIDSYRRKDFEMAVESLTYFDNKNRVGVVDTPQWDEIVSKMNDLYEPDGEEEESEPTPPPASDKKEANTGESDHILLMNRDELKQYIKKNSYNITILKAMTDDDIRQKISLYEESIKEEIEEIDEPTGNVSELSKSTPSKTGGYKDRLRKS